MADATTRAWTAASRKEEALWVLDNLAPSSGANNLTTAIQADGLLDGRHLRAALALVTGRHPALRTVFRATAAGLFKDVTAAEAFAIDVPTVTAGPDGAAPELQRIAALPFTFDGTPLVRAAHVMDGKADVFLLVAHHLVCDALSTEVIARELTAAYAAVHQGSPLPEELACEVPALIEGPPREESLRYWHEQLSGFDPTTLGLWCGSTVPDDPSLTGGYVMRDLSPRAREAIRQCQRVARAPEAVVLLAAYVLLLVRHGAGPDIVVGTPASVRPLEAATAVGYHVNTLPLRVPVHLEVSFRELVRQVRDVFFGALAHADVPVDMMLGDVRGALTRSWRNPVFRHLFNYVPDSAAAASTPFDMGDVSGRRILVENGFSKFDLEFFFVSAPDGLGLRAAYDTDAFSREDVVNLMDRFEALVIELGSSPDLLSGEACLLSTLDRQVIEAANQTRRSCATGSVLDQVANRVQSDPDAVAVEDGDDRATYAQLWRRAGELGDRLRECGVGEGSVVALLMPRGVDLAVATLGVWMAGATYLPLDPEHPLQRLRFQLTDSGARVVIAGSEAPVPQVDGLTVLYPTDGSSSEGRAIPGPPTPLSGDAPAYLIYTSGSTGRPKGTTVTHGSLINLLEHFEEQLSAGPGDATLWMTTFSFDISALELFLPLTTGGRVCICPDRARTDGRFLAERLDRLRIGIIQATPTTWRVLLDGVAPALKGRRVLCGGEPLPQSLARHLQDTGCMLWNVYGPTETTIWSTSGRIDAPEGRVHVGRPIANTRVIVVDPAGEELPIGVIGELRIAGKGVALGYHGRPDLTAERFVHHPPHGRAYRTGDLARWTADGFLEVLGRVDRQVKVRGNRIELGEVENALEAHPSVSAAAVVQTPDDGGALVAFLLPAEGPMPTGDEMWRHACHLLPRAAVPQEWHLVRSFPRTGNDKIDYVALLAQAERRGRQSTGGCEAPMTDADTETEEVRDPVVAELMALWRQVLGRDDITARSNFFAMGGHSLLAVQVLQRVEDRLHVRLKLADMFTDPTPVGLANCLRRAEHPQSNAPDPPGVERG